MSEIEEPTVDQMFEDVSDNAGAQEQPEGQPAESKETEPQMFEYTALGETRKEPLDLILKRASQGYDYASKQDAMKAQQAALDERLADANVRFDKYGQIDEYARENPEWYDHWSQAYEQRQAGQNQQEQPAVDLSPIKSEIDGLRNEFSEVKDFVTKQQQSQEDGKYWDQIKKITDEFPGIDFNQANDKGETLEYRVLEHCKQEGITNFRVGFRDYYHDKIKSQAAEMAKQDLIKADKENRRKGIVGVSNTPMLNSDMPDIRGMSDNDSLAAAIAEFEGME